MRLALLSGCNKCTQLVCLPSLLIVPLPSYLLAIPAPSDSIACDIVAEAVANNQSGRRAVELAQVGLSCCQRWSRQRAACTAALNADAPQDCWVIRCRLGGMRASYRPVATCVDDHTHPAASAVQPGRWPLWPMCCVLRGGSDGDAASAWVGAALNPEHLNAVEYLNFKKTSNRFPDASLLGRGAPRCGRPSCAGLGASRRARALKRRDRLRRRAGWPTTSHSVACRRRAALPGAPACAAPSRLVTYQSWSPDTLLCPSLSLHFICSWSSTGLRARACASSGHLRQ